MKKCRPLFLLPLAASISLLLSTTPLFAQDEEAPATPATLSSPAATSAAPAATETKSFENSVVRVFSTQRAPDLSKPWTKLSPKELSGSGVIIEGKRILTNAHMVTYASQVQVQGNQSGDKLLATVEFYAPQVDLAVLKIEDESFFDSRPPIQRDTALPHLKQNVMAYGYPTGGTTISITKGIVSRIEFVNYGPNTQGLRIQIDAAINPGNSGGPAMSGDKMIGLAFSGIQKAQSIGYIIPTEEIELFLKDIADGKYDGKSALFDSLQTLENGALRSYLKLPAGAEGLLVSQLENDDPNYPLQPWDLITHYGEVPVDNQGMVKIKEAGDLRIRAAYLIQHIEKDGKVPMTIIRKGKTMTVQVPTRKDSPSLIHNTIGEAPSYFIYGPMVFSSISSETYSQLNQVPSALIQALAQLKNPIITRRGDKPSTPDEELVIVPSAFFSHKLSKGYGSPVLRVISTINGVHVRNLKHLVELLRDSTEEFTVITFESRGGEHVVFPHKEALAATEQILIDNGIRSQASADLLPIWNAKH
jgi:S1-C subfamily serine protease